MDIGQCTTDNDRDAKLSFASAALRPCGDSAFAPESTDYCYWWQAVSGRLSEANSNQQVAGSRRSKTNINRGVSVVRDVRGVFANARCPIRNRTAGLSNSRFHIPNSRSSNLEFGIWNSRKPGLKTPRRFTCFSRFRRFISFIRFIRFRNARSAFRNETRRVGEGSSRQIWIWAPSVGKNRAFWYATKQGRFFAGQELFALSGLPKNVPSETRQICTAISNNI